ncbi:MAG: RNA polymerase sigma factor [bacterium]
MTKKNQHKLEEEFKTIFGEHEKGLRSYAFFKVNSIETSIDLVQDTFTKTWNYLVKGGKIYKIKAFLYHILNHLIIDQYRKHKSASLDTLLEQGFEPAAGDPAEVYNLLDSKKAIGLVSRLPEKCKKVMRMKYVQDLSLEEISSATGASKNTISVQLHRGLEKLRLLYNQ